MAWLYDTALMSQPPSAPPATPVAARLVAQGVASEAASPSAPDDVRRRRLLFRATHRGTNENDLMLGGFVRAHLAGLDDSDLTALEVLLDLPDPDLADWLTGREPIPAEQDDPLLRHALPMLHRIRAAVSR
jgi:antitoxin CptB